MKRVGHAPSVTSLPQSPQDEATHRVRRYALTMGIRTICFLAMALVQPIGWWTWAFAAAAIFLPYVAVVYANAGSDSNPSTVESPVKQITASPRPSERSDADASGVFTISERSPQEGDAAASEKDDDAAEHGDEDDRGGPR